MPAYGNADMHIFFRPCSEKPTQVSGNSNPYAIFGGKSYVTGSEANGDQVKVFVIENITDGSFVARLEHNTETGIITLFDGSGNKLGKKQLSEYELAWGVIDPKAEKFTLLVRMHMH